jgi:hypothetical protein
LPTAGSLASTSTARPTASRRLPPIRRARRKARPRHPRRPASGCVWAELAKGVDKGARAEQASSFAKPPAAPGTSARAGGRTRDQVRDWAELALGADPLSAHALRILGQLADANGDDTRASQYMRAAARRSMRESVAVYWLMRKSYENGDYAAAIYGADVLLRTRSETMPYVMPTLVQMAQSKDANGELKKLLAGNPRVTIFRSCPKCR